MAVDAARASKPVSDASGATTAVHHSRASVSRADRSNSKREGVAAELPSCAFALVGVEASLGMKTLCAKGPLAEVGC